MRDSKAFFIFISSPQTKGKIEAWETTIQNELKQLEKFSYYAKPP
jgi:hypothetical protein